VIIRGNNYYRRRLLTVSLFLLLFVSLIYSVINACQYGIASRKGCNLEVLGSTTTDVVSSYSADKSIGNSIGESITNDSLGVPGVNTNNYENTANETSQSDSDGLRRIILQYFIDKGLTVAQASGIVGNIEQESGLNPKKIQGGAIATKNYKLIPGRGFGFVQWTVGNRQKGLVELAKSMGCEITDPYLQLDYIWLELHTGYGDALLKLERTTTPTEAAVVFHDYYLRSNDSRQRVIASRGGNAERIYRSREQLGIIFTVNQ
jgi:hypothetical protein